MHQINSISTKAKQASGFTLIELSIVLVIIGLVAGGVLVGNSLINTAKIRGEISQIQKIKTAVAAFKLEYDCLPGDCKDAFEWGLVAEAGKNGNGDGLISIIGTDIVTAIPMLKEAGLIDTVNGGAPFEALIPSKLLDSMGYLLIAFEDTKKNYITQFQLGSVEFTPSAGSAPSAKQAFQMDSKIDDGLPFAGQIQVLPTGAEYFDSVDLGDVYGVSGLVDADCASSTDHTVTDATYKRGDEKDCPFIVELGF